MKMILLLTKTQSGLRRIKDIARDGAMRSGLRLRLVAAAAGVAVAIWSGAAAAFAVYGLIGNKYAWLGGENGALGAPRSDEADASFGGRFNEFAAGSVWWHPSIGEAFAVWGDIGVKYRQLGGPEFGYPITDETPTADGVGRFNHFRSVHLPGTPESSIFWSPTTGAHAVYGAIREAWANQGWERGPLGYPVSDEFPDGEFRMVNFQNGFIIWSATGGAVVELAGGVEGQAIDPGTNLVPVDE
jgi:uncharacterized protein with LGFP repeats